MTPPIRALLIDVSGTLSIGSKPIGNAVSALARLREAKIPFRFCTNTSKESTRELCQKLEGMKFEVRKDEVWSSIGALKQLLKEKSVKRPYLLLENEVRQECSEGLSDDDAIPHDSVVLGLAPSLLDYEHMNTAFQILTQGSQTSTSPSEKPPFIVTHKAKYMRAPDNLLSLSLGPFVTALESASGVEAMAIGKPARPFFEGAISSLQLTPGNHHEGGRIVVIGDDIEGDLGDGALDLGLWRILVRTGKYRSGDETKPGVVPPDETVDSFAEWVDQYFQKL